MTLHEMQRRLKGFDIREEVANSINATKEEYVNFNLMQLLRGLTKDGEYLSPKYSEDPWFKSKESALRYAQWKKKIEPIKTDRPIDVPNLFITGRYHRSIEVNANSEDIVFTSGDPNASSIEGKFDDIYGLNTESKGKYIPEYFFPQLKVRITRKLGFKFE